MTDKDKLSAVRAEIERLEKENCMNGGEHFCMRRAQCLGRLHQLIDSLQEELVSEELENNAIQYAGKHAPYDDAMDEVEEAFKAGAKWKEQQMMKDAFVFESKHNIACCLASECLRNHGWFGRERDFNNLWQFICGVKELFSGEFKTDDKVKLIIIKEE